MINDDTLDDSNQGIELQVQSWPMEDMGFAFVFGHSEWDLDIRPDVIDIEIPVTTFTEEGVAEESSRSGKSNTTSEGDITATSIGFSFISDIPITRALSINPNIGLRYVFIDADGKAVKREEFNPAAVVAVADGGFDADDAVLGVVGLDARLTLTELLSILVGVGYQFDIVPAEIKTRFGDGSSVSYEIEFDAFYGQVAAALTF